MLIPLLLLVLITPFLVVRPFQEELVMPKLAATAAFVGAALVWGAVLLVRDRWPSGRWPPAVWVALGAFVVVNVLALAFATDPRGSLLGEFRRYQGLAPTLLYALLFVVAGFAVRTTRDLTWLLLALVLAAFGTSVYALIQKAGLDWADLTGRDPGRPGSTVGQANNFGAFLVMVLSASVFLFFALTALWQRALLGALLIVALFALFFTVSRSAYLAGALAALLWGAFALVWVLPRLRQNDRLAAAVGIGSVTLGPLVLAVGAIFFVGLPQGRVAVAGEANSEAVQGRLSLWRLGLEMAVDRPLLGYGQDGFSMQFPAYRDEPDLPGIGTRSVDPESAHNFYVDLVSGTGFLGLGAFLLLVGVIYWYAARRLLMSDDWQHRLAVAGLGVAALTNLAALFFGFAEAMTTWLLWLLLGALVGLLALQPDEREEEEDDGLALGGLGAGAGAVLLVVLGATALGWAATLSAAELASGQADSARRDGRDLDAVRLADRAASLNPLNREYLLQKAQLLEESQRWEEAIETYETANGRFTPTAFAALSQALAQISLLQESRSAPVETAFPLLERALELDRFNEEFRFFASDKYEQLGSKDEALRHRYTVLLWRGQQSD